MHIDPRPDFLGQVLLVTDDGTNEIIDYKIQQADPKDLCRFEIESKLNFHMDVNENAEFRNDAARYFTNMLGSADQIDVYGSFVRRRFPSTCTYIFDSERVIRDGADPPFNFDYGLTRSISPVRVGHPEALEEQIALMKRRTLSQEEAHDFPGFTNRRGFVEVLRSKACPYIEDDVISTPFFLDFEKKWYPTLREDGHSGLYRSMRKPDRVFIIMESALPYFLCDQMIVLMKNNPQKWTWEDWVQSEEIVRLKTLAKKSIEEVKKRELQNLKESPARVEEASERAATESFSLTFNVLRRTGNKVAYDAEICRPEDWYKKKMMLLKILAKQEDEYGYVILKNIDCSGTDIERVLPTVFTVECFRDAEKEVKRMLPKEKSSVVDVEILREWKKMHH